MQKYIYVLKTTKCMKRIKICHEKERADTQMGESDLEVL